MYENSVIVCFFVTYILCQLYFTSLFQAEELLKSGDPKWAHMKLPLHVKISALAPIDQVSSYK